MTEWRLADIERTMIQFGGAFAAAGPIRAVSSRVLDVLPVVTRGCRAASSGARPHRTTGATDGPLGGGLACLGGGARRAPRRSHNKSRLSPARTIRTLRRGHP